MSICLIGTFYYSSSANLSSSSSVLKSHFLNDVPVNLVLLLLLAAI